MRLETDFDETIVFYALERAIYTGVWPLKEFINKLIEIWPQISERRQILFKEMVEGIMPPGGMLSEDGNPTEIKEWNRILDLPINRDVHPPTGKVKE